MCTGNSLVTQLYLYLLDGHFLFTAWELNN